VGRLERVLPTGFDVYVGLEAEASSLRAFESLVVHGLLQTEEYARAVMSTVRRKLSPEEIDALVALRMQRQGAILRPDPLDLWLVLDEAVISRTMGPPDLMRRQFKYLAEASLRSNVTMQVLPFASGPHPSLNGPFAIIEFPERFDPDVVYTEGVHGQAYLERERDVRSCAEAFDLLRAASLSPADSTDLISGLASSTNLSEKGTSDDSRPQ
jgi:hypothetical protein